jgi:hypothetical protein
VGEIAHTLARAALEHFGIQNGVEIDSRRHWAGLVELLLGRPDERPACAYAVPGQPAAVGGRSLRH